MLGAGEKAAALADETRTRFELVGRMRPLTLKPSRVLFVLSLQNGRPMVGGRGTSADAIIRLAGAVNAADAIEGFKPMTDEGVIAAAPDVDPQNDQWKSGRRQGRYLLTACASPPRLPPPSRALIGMDGLYLLGFGPRTPDAARDLMAALYPTVALPALPPLAGQ